VSLKKAIEAKYQDKLWSAKASEAVSFIVTELKILSEREAKLIIEGALKFNLEQSSALELT